MVAACVWFAVVPVASKSSALVPCAPTMSSEVATMMALHGGMGVNVSIVCPYCVR